MSVFGKMIAATSGLRALSEVSYMSRESGLCLWDIRVLHVDPAIPDVACPVSYSPKIFASVDMGKGCSRAMYWKFRTLIHCCAIQHSERFAWMRYSNSLLVGHDGCMDVRHRGYLSQGFEILRSLREVLIDCRGKRLYTWSVENTWSSLLERK